MKIRYIFAIVALSSLVSCNDSDVYEREQYKHVLAFVSGTDNINTKTVSMDDDETSVDIAFSVGGSNPTDRDVTVNVVEDPALIATYNKNTYDVNVSKYARQLPRANYSIPSLQCVVKAGEPTGYITVKIYPEGLSPDSTFFIPLRVDSYNTYEMNPDKDYILYRIQTRNKWAKSDGTSVYTMRGKRLDLNNMTEISLPGTKVLSPLSRNSVRILAGNETYSSTAETFNRFGIILTVGDDGKVDIKPYKDLKVEQIDGDADYPNKFFYEFDGFNYYKTFLLHYSYQVDNNKYQIREELRFRYDKSEESGE